MPIKFFPFEKRKREMERNERKRIKKGMAGGGAWGERKEVKKRHEIGGRVGGEECVMQTLR